MCIWCIRDGVFTDKDWEELLKEERHRPSLIDQVQQFFRSRGTNPEVSDSEKRPRTA